MNSVNSLIVLIGGTPAGHVTRQRDGSLSFRYEDAYDGVPLSISMPVSNRSYPDKVIRPYLYGLLPDNKAVRSSIARQFEVHASSPLDLLACIGLDCPGAVQLCAEGDFDRAVGRPGSYVRLDESDVESRLRRLQTAAEDSWVGREEHWSLGGNQGKFALARIDGAWCECRGSAATTHIFKNGISGYRYQALNECICMRLAHACGLPCAEVEYGQFGDEWAIIVSRYDRAAATDGRVVRLHQEDLCQALGVMPDRKYTSDGGPCASDVLRLLARTSLAQQNVALFIRMLFFNCLIGAPDAHAKNYSLLLAPGPQVLMAPMYDVASGLAYESLRRKGRLAMSIGGENRFGRMSATALGRFARNAGIGELGFDGAWCVGEMARIADLILARLGDVFDDGMGIPGCAELRGHLEGSIVGNCKAILAQIGA